jgi:hypothetical protein
MAERKQQDRGFLAALIQHPRCAILPSPEKLDTSLTSPGEDETNTRGDFDKVCKWLNSSKFLNIGFHADAQAAVDKGELLQMPVYKSLIKLAFSAFDPIRHTHDAERDEMVLLYYAGHGLMLPNAANFPNGCSSSPNLHLVGFGEDKLQEFADAESNYLTQNRTVKGGELCLHDVGYCDLQGLLTPWIAAVTKESDKAPGVKKNKHLVVIADSCYSGKLVEELRHLATIPNKPWNSNDCTVTVQSACSSNESTVGGYFTPLFIHLNKNPQILQQLKDEWNGLSEQNKNSYRQDQLLLASPQVASTMQELNLGTALTVDLPSIQGVQLTLFHDAGFFKFCSRQSRLNERSARRLANVQAMQQN